MANRQECFIIIQCRESIGNLPTKVLAPIPEAGITEYLKNEIGDIPSMGAGVWQQVLGRKAEKTEGSLFRGLSSVLAAESIWVGGNKRVFTFDLEFHAWSDPYKEVYLPVKALQFMSLPREQGGQGAGGDKSKIIQAVHDQVASIADAVGVDTFYYRAPPNVSFIVVSMLEEDADPLESFYSDEIRSPGEVRPRSADVISSLTSKPDALSSKSILVYSPKAIISSLSVGWQQPFFKGKGGVYPSSAKVQIQIDTLKVATDADIALEKPDKNAGMQLRGVSHTYIYS